MAEPRPPRLTAEAVKQLEDGISLVFSRWPALQYPIENQLLGRRTNTIAQSFASDVLDFFDQPRSKEDSEPFVGDLEKLLLNGLDSLEMIPEDGSPEQVADDLMDMYYECLDGNYESIQKLRDLKPVPVRVIKQVASDSNSDDDDEKQFGIESGCFMKPCSSSSMSNHDEDVPQDMEVDDGWTTVCSKKKNEQG